MNTEKIQSIVGRMLLLSLLLVSGLLPAEAEAVPPLRLVDYAQPAALRTKTPQGLLTNEYTWNTAANFVTGHFEYTEVISGTNAVTLQRLHRWSANVRVDDAPSGNQGVPSLAMGTDGTIYAMWNDSRNGNDNIYFARSADGGATWNTNVRVDDAPSGKQLYPSLSVGMDGTLYAVWEDSRDSNPDIHNPGIYFARSTDGGATWSANVRIDDGSFSWQMYPSLAIGANDTLYAAWRNSAHDIYFARSTDNGATWGANIRVDNTTSANIVTSQYPALAVGADGTLYIAWDDYVNNDSIADLYFSRSTDNGVTWSAGIRIDNAASGVRRYPSLIIDTDGTYYVVWMDTRNGSWDIYFSRSLDNGATWSVDIRVDDAQSGAQRYPSLAVGVDGTLYAAWDDQRNDNADIYLARSSDGGVTWSKNERADDAAVGHQVVPTLAASSDGAVHIAWGDYRNGSDSDIYFTRWPETSMHTAGTYTASLVDADAEMAWAMLAYTTTLPAGTGVTFTVRTGGSPTPDIDWSDWYTLTTSSADLSVLTSGQYLQWRAWLSSANSTTTPVLDAVTVTTTASPHHPFFITLHGLDKVSSGISSRYVITNQGSVEATVVHEFYDESEQFIAEFISNVPTETSHTYDLATISVIPYGYSGYAIVSADQPITGAILSFIPPAVPTLNPIDNVGGSNSYTVSWSSVSNATGYTLQEAANSSFTGAVTAYSGSNTSTSISGKSPGTYYYRVRASNAGGDSAWSNTQSVVVLATYTLTLNTAGTGSGILTPTVGAHEYVSGTLVTLQAAPNVESTFDGWSGDVDCIDGIVTVNADKACTATFSLVVVTPPAAPTLNGIDNVDGDGSYTISWSSVSGATSYTLQEATNSAFTGATTAYSGSNTSTSINGNLSGTYYYRVRTSNAGGDSAWSNTQSVTVTDSVDGDAYEPDDACAQARAIPPDGTVQQRTFHKQADEDWVVFEGLAGTTYRIEAHIPPESPADVTLELHGQCAGLPLGTQNHTFSPGVRLEFEAPTSGAYYLRWTNHDPTVFGAEVAYHVSVQALGQEATPGALVIVAGRDKVNDPLQPNIHYAAEQLYQVFQAYGYPAERIYYLATNPARPGYSAPATTANLQAAITTWAAARVGPERPFTLYMIDHGKPNELYLDKPAGQTVSPAQVDAWLSELEAAHPGLKVNMIVEACHSGSFIRLPQTVSKPGRVVISSTGVWNLAYASAQGAIFSDHFTVALYQGQSLYQSFQSARWATQNAFPFQTPWLDDDGDGIPNQPGDGQVAAVRGFAYAGTLSGDVWPPHIFAAAGPSEIAQGRGVIRAEVRDDEQVKRVWAVIYPPSYRPPESGEELISEVLPTIVLQAQGNDQFAATYTGFDALGVYRVVVYAEDNGGREARPVAVEVRTGWGVYLPLVMRQQEW